MNGRTPAAIASIVTETIASVTGQSIDAIGPQASLFDDLGLDSASALQLLVELEDAFGIFIGSADAAGMRTVADVQDYITRRVAGAG